MDATQKNRYRLQYPKDDGIVSQMEASAPVEAALDQVLSSVRHRLGNTVSSVKITLELLVKEYDRLDDVKKAELLRRALAQVRDQHRLLDALKTYYGAVVEQGAEFGFDPFFVDWLGHARAGTPGIVITHRRRATTGNCRINGDQKAIATVLDALIANAADAMADVAHPVVELTTEVRAGYVQITVADRGGGIAPRDLPTIFLPFFSTKRDRYGLGLSIARKLLLQLEGLIAVHSTQGEGTRAVVRLPLVKTAAAHRCHGGRDRRATIVTNTRTPTA
jgi:signal transduction histidine kinase